MLGPQTLLRPPTAISPHVRSFCRDITADHAPDYVAVAPRPGARRHMCFSNVAALVERERGDIVYGWLIREWEQTLLEAEHHAVWRRDGNLIDVTPPKAPTTRNLFLPDPLLTFDFATRKRRDNRRKALRNCARVREYVALSAAFVAVEEANSTRDHVELTPEAAAELDRIRARLDSIETELVAWSVNRIGRNDHCPCGSGRKAKKCCLGGGDVPIMGQAAGTRRGDVPPAGTRAG